MSYARAERADTVEPSLSATSGWEATDTLG